MTYRAVILVPTLVEVPGVNIQDAGHNARRLAGEYEQVEGHHAKLLQVTGDKPIPDDYPPPPLAA